jgi:shikimate kinase
MSLVYITGISGSGKSTVRNELQSRGLEAYDIDSDGLAYWQNIITGEITHGIDASGRSVEFSEHNQWRLDLERVRRLLQTAEGRLIFLCGSAPSNEAEVWDSFSKVVYLDIDKETMRGRVTNRTTGDYGKNPNEVEALLGWHEGIDHHYRERADTTIDATKPTDDIVDEVLVAVDDDAVPSNTSHS